MRHKLGTGSNTKKIIRVTEHVCAADWCWCCATETIPSHSILCCSMFSIMAARASTLLMISFSSSVSSSPGAPPDTFIVLQILSTNTPTHKHTNTQSVSGMQSKKCSSDKRPISLKKKCIAKEVWTLRSTDRSAAGNWASAKKSVKQPQTQIQTRRLRWKEEVLTAGLSAQWRHTNIREIDATWPEKTKKKRGSEGTEQTLTLNSSRARQFSAMILRLCLKLQVFLAELPKAAFSVSNHLWPADGAEASFSCQWESDARAKSRCCCCRLLSVCPSDNLVAETSASRDACRGRIWARGNRSSVCLDSHGVSWWRSSEIQPRIWEILVQIQLLTDFNYSLKGNNGRSDVTVSQITLWHHSSSVKPWRYISSRC